VAGYSGTPLARKLGIQAGHRVALLSAPRGFERLLAPLPADVTILQRTSGRAPVDVVLLFVRRRSELERRFGYLSRQLADAGGVWVAWPKKASGVETDLSFDVVQKVGLATGLVDNKVCAIDETYSGLRFVIRKENRATGSPAERRRSRTRVGRGRTAS
jgi:hypothetical protein